MKTNLSRGAMLPSQHQDAIRDVVRFLAAEGASSADIDAAVAEVRAASRSAVTAPVTVALPRWGIEVSLRP